MPRLLFLDVFTGPDTYATADPLPRHTAPDDGANTTQSPCAASLSARQTKCLQDDIDHLAASLARHMVRCRACCLDEWQPCHTAQATARAYEDLSRQIPSHDDRQEVLIRRIITARFTGRAPDRLDVLPLVKAADSDPQPPAKHHTCEPRPLTFEAMINHFTRCKVCYPAGGKFCHEGKRVKAAYDKSQGE